MNVSVSSMQGFICVNEVNFFYIFICNSARVWIRLTVLTHFCFCRTVLTCNIKVWMICLQAIHRRGTMRRYYGYCSKCIWKCLKLAIIVFFQQISVFSFSRKLVCVTIFVSRWTSTAMSARLCWVKCIVKLIQKKEHKIYFAECW